MWRLRDVCASFRKPGEQWSQTAPGQNRHCRFTHDGIQTRELAAVPAQSPHPGPKRRTGPGLIFMCAQGPALTGGHEAAAAPYANTAVYRSTCRAREAGRCMSPQKRPKMRIPLCCPVSGKTCRLSARVFVWNINQLSRLGLESTTV